MGISRYPLSDGAVAAVCMRRGLSPEEEGGGDTLVGSAYNLAVADVLLWLSDAPDISQGGQSYSFTDGQRSGMRRRASALYAAYGFGDGGAGVSYGYKGDRL